MTKNIKSKITFRDCDCAADKELVGGVLPEYFDNEEKAIERFIHRCKMNVMFFAVHAKGKHILTVKAKEFVYGGFALVRRR